MQKATFEKVKDGLLETPKNRAEMCICIRQDGKKMTTEKRQY